MIGCRKLAEGSGSRTYQTRRASLDGFEARARHRTRIPSMSNLVGSGRGRKGARGGNVEYLIDTRDQLADGTVTAGEAASVEKFQHVHC